MHNSVGIARGEHARLDGGQDLLQALDLLLRLQPLVLGDLGIRVHNSCQSADAVADEGMSESEEREDSGV